MRDLNGNPIPLPIPARPSADPAPSGSSSSRSAPRSPVEWYAKAPIDHVRGIKVLSPSPRGELTVLVVSSAVCGVWTHYTDKRTMPCTRTTGTCLCLDAPETTSRRWRGYVGCVVPGQLRYFLCEVTLNAMLSCAPLRNPSVTLRGSLLKLTRTGAARNSPVVAELYERPAWSASTPAEFDVPQSLCVLWGLPLAFAKNIGEEAPDE